MQIRTLLKSSAHTPVIQPKLALGPVDDPFEREADKMAEQMAQSNSRAGSAPMPLAPPTLQRQSPPAIVNSAAAVTPQVESAIQQAGGGQTLPSATRIPMEQAMGFDFSKVRIHTDRRADQLNRSLTARAFTTGQDVFFREGEYQPESSEGQKLLAHELTHVVQQNNTQEQAPQRTIQRMLGNRDDDGTLPFVKDRGGNDYAVTEVTIGDVYAYMLDTGNLVLGTDDYYHWEDGWGEASSEEERIEESDDSYQSDSDEDDDFNLGAHLDQILDGPPTVQNLGMPVEGVVPIDQRPIAELFMGQGLVANLGQIILHSDEFSTCSPIVMFNRETLEGGLFHFPAGHPRNQGNNLINMYNRVLPTQIYLNDRSIEFPPMPSDDHNLLQVFFRDTLDFHGDITMIHLRSSQYAITLDRDEQNVLITNEIVSTGGNLSVANDFTIEGSEQVQESWRAAPATTKFGRDDWHR